jgi:hypothetical protein
MRENLQGDSSERRPPRFSRGHRVALAGLAAAVFVYYLDYLRCKTFFWDDMLRWYYPAVNYFCVAVAAGGFPFWVPGLLNGVPLYTDVQTAIYYPFTWLLVPFARGGALPIAIYQWYVVLHILMGGVFMYVYLKHHRLGPLACLLGAMVFCFAGFTALHVNHIPMLQVYAWLPLQLLFVDKAVLTRKAKYYALLTGVILLSFFGGFPQTMLYDSYLLIAYWLYRRYRALPGETPRTVLAVGRQLGSECLRIAGVFGSVLLLGAVQLVPTLEHLHLTARRQFDFQSIAWDSMPLHYLVQFVIPNFFGVSNCDGTGVTFWGYDKNMVWTALPRFGCWQYWDFGAYAGQLSVIALVASVFHHRRLRNTPVRFFVVGWILALWFMLGRYGGLFNVLYHIVPGISLFRSPSRMASVLDLCSAVLVAFVVDSQAPDSPPRLDRPLGVVLVLYAVGCCCYLVWGARVFPELRGAVQAAFASQQTVISFLLFLGMGICLLGMRNQTAARLRVVSGAVLAVLTCADLYHAYGFFHGGRGNPREFYDLNSWIVEKHMDLVREVGPTRFAQVTDGQWGQFAMDVNAPLWQRELETPQGYVDLVPRHTARLSQMTNQTALLDLQNVGTIFALDSVTGQCSIRYRRTLSRIVFYSTIKPYNSDDEILHDLDSDRLDYRNTVAVRADELDSALDAASTGTNAPPFDLQFRRDSPEKYRIRYSVNSPGILFISESYYPGWEAIDTRGKTFKIVRTFTAFKGIVIPQAGQGELTVRFRPRSFRLGAGISGTTAVLLGMLYFALIRRDRCTIIVAVSTSKPHPPANRQTPAPVGAG